MSEKRIIGGKDWDWNYGRNRSDMKAEAKWKESKDRKETKERKDKNK